MPWCVSLIQHTTAGLSLAASGKSDLPLSSRPILPQDSYYMEQTRGLKETEELILLFLNEPTTREGGRDKSDPVELDVS